MENEGSYHENGQRIGPERAEVVYRGSYHTLRRQ